MAGMVCVWEWQVKLCDTLATRGPLSEHFRDSTL